jgi:hypothetical protein
MHRCTGVIISTHMTVNAISMHTTSLECLLWRCKCLTNNFEGRQPPHSQWKHYIPIDENFWSMFSNMPLPVCTYPYKPNDREGGKPFDQYCNTTIDAGQIRSVLNNNTECPNNFSLTVTICVAWTLLNQFQFIMNTCIHTDTQLASTCLM